MQRVAEQQSSQGIELRETGVASPDPIVREERQTDPPPLQAGWLSYKKGGFLIALLTISTALISNINEKSDQSPAAPSDAFNFLVFCPYSYYPNRTILKDDETPNSEMRRRLFSQGYSYNIEINPKDKDNFDSNRTYVVQAQSINFTKGKQPGVRLFYCGLVRNFYKQCSEETFMACSSPGPMFDIPARESVDIIWVNKLDPSLVPNVGDSCMNKTLYPHGSSFCSIMAKINRTQTFLDPTGLMDLSTPLKHMEITNTSWPVSMHLHGAEIRPTFDGNPLSWFDNRPYSDGQVGVATFSLDEECYYGSFDQDPENNYKPPRIKLIGDVGKSNYKINRYPNKQNPGTLWYHDHAMHLTNYNVQYGLAGFYILRDEKVQETIGVDRCYEKLVMITSLGFPMQPSFPLSGFEPGKVYRFRFLNNNFGDGRMTMIRISFSYDNCNDKLNDRESFSIIGADSSLFKNSIDDQKSFIITQAERMEILIIFQNKTSFSICANKYDTPVDKIGQKQQKPTVMSSDSHGKHNDPQNDADSYSIKGIKLDGGDKLCLGKNNKKNITKVSLDVPYIDFASWENITITRMRPLMYIDEIFTINGRTEFHKGESENPVLGTMEDWIIINTISFVGHPIHVHLINFQVIREYNLTTFTTQGGNTCSLYEMDFYLQAMLKANWKNQTNSINYKSIVLNGREPNGSVYDGYINYTFLCDNKDKIGSRPQVQQSFNKIYLQNTTNPNNNSLTGHDLFLKFKSSDPNLRSSPFNFQKNSTYRYIVNGGHPSDKPYYSRWKDTAFVDKFKALHYRIRWTKSNYTPEDEKKGTYFHVPNDQLREFPGFVYHCHILDHEDNEMMRPIMMQLPNDAQLNMSTPCNSFDISSKKALKWSDKYNCINSRCNNNKTIH